MRNDSHSTKKSRFDRLSEGALEWVVQRYTHGLEIVLRHQRLTLLSFALVMASTVYLYTALPKGFFPTQDTGVMSGATQAAPDISFQAMSERQQAVAEILLQDPAIQGLGSFIGVGNGNSVNTGRMFIALKPPDERDPVDVVVERLRKKLSRVQGVRAFVQPVQDIRVGGRSGNAQYQYALSDQDLNELNHWAPLLVEKLRANPQLKDVNSDQLVGGLQANVVIDRDAAARMGITPLDIDNAVYNAFGQRQVANLYTQQNQYHVVLEALPRYQLDPESLERVYVEPSGAASNGKHIPLSAVAKVAYGPTPLAVTHQGQFPAATLSFNLAPGLSLGGATAAIDRTTATLGLPSTMSGSFQGTAQVFNESLRNQPMLILAALLAVYVVLGVLYESLIHPLTILSTLPSAGLGALLALLITGYELSIISLIGIILLIGIVKKNGIMLVDFALEAERTQGLTPEQSIFQACVLRFRPILMTTMAALLGAVPLAVGSGVGSELRKPLGIAIVGGLLVSQLLTLFTTPVIYLVLDRVSQRWRQRKREGPSAAGA